MAGALSVLRLLIEAKDEASKVIDKVEKKTKQLDKQKASVDITADTKGAEGAFAKMKSAGGSALDFVKKNAASIAISSAGALATVAVKLTTSFEKLALEVGKFADATGLSNEMASRWMEVAGDLGVENSTLESVVGKMNKTLGSTPQVFEDLGVQIAKTQTGVTDVSQTFLNAIQRLGDIKDPAERAAAGFKLFGRGWTQVAELIGTGADDLKKRLASVNEGLVIGDDKVGKAREMRDAMDDMGDAIESAGLEIGSTLAPAISELANDAAFAADVLSRIPGIAGEIDAKIPSAAKKAGLSLSHLGDSWIDIRDQFVFNARNLFSGGRFGTEKDKLTEFWTNVIGAAAEGADASGAATKSAIGDLDSLNSALDRVRDPHGFQQFHSQWQVVMSDLADGKINSQDTTDAIQFLMDALNITDPTQVLGLAVGEMGRLGDAATKTGQKVALTADDIQKAIDAIEQFAVKGLQAEDTLVQMSSAFDTMASKQTALSAVFDLKNAPLTAAGQLRDISIAINELSDAADGIDLSKPLDPKNVKADKLLDAFDALRPQIQAKITETFSTGGPEAAQKLADSYIEQIFKEFGGRLSRTEIARITGLDDLQATVHVGLELSDIDRARRQLDILTGLGGETPLTASIKLALDAGTITGQQAQTLIQQQLAGFQVPVPSTLAAPETAQAIAGAQAALGNLPVGQQPTMPTRAGDPNNVADVLSTTQATIDGLPVTITVTSDSRSAKTAGQDAVSVSQGTVNGKPVTIIFGTDTKSAQSAGANGAAWAQSGVTPVKIPFVADTFQLDPVIKRIFGLRDSGGTVGRDELGVVAEKRPEILNGRYLATQPTVVPPGTRVTSGARTARILRTRGARGLKPYDSGGTVKAGPSTVNLVTNFNGVGAIGSRFDLMRTVKRANLDRARLLGTRG